MATFERTGLMTYIDENGNLYILYPVTNIDAVDGLQEALDSKRSNTWTPTAEEVGAAPDFLAEYVKTFGINTGAILDVPNNNFNTLTGNSIYKGLSGSATGVPEGIGEWAFILTLHYDEGSQFGVQLALDMHGHGLCHRNKRNGVWNQWGCYNPPMMPGVEYRTTKRYHDTPVYTKKLSDVWVPAGQFVEAATGVDHNHLISYKAMMRNGSYAMAEMLPYHNYLGNLLGNVRQTANGIAIDNFDTEGFSAEIYIEYWK